MIQKKYYFSTILLSLLFPLFAQTKQQQKLDSLETVLFSFEANDTLRIVKSGIYIYKNTSSDSQKFKVLQRISEAYFRTNAINKSIDYSFKAKEIAEKIADPERMATAYGTIANQYSFLNLTDKARYYLGLAMQQIEKLPQGDKMYRLKALSYLELGNLDFNNKNYKAANKNYKNALHQFELVKETNKKHIYNYRRSLYNIGNSYYYLNQPDSAEVYLQKALKIKDTENRNLNYYIYSTLSEVYTLRGNHRQAISTLQSILKDPDFNITSLRLEIYLNLSRNYQKIGDKANYTLYNEKHLSLRDTLEDHDLKAIDTAFKMEQKDLSESILKTEQYNQWLVLGILLMVITSGSIFFYLHKKKREKHLKYLSVIEKLKRPMAFSIETQIEKEIEVKTNYSVPSFVEEDILIGLQKFEEEEKFRNPKLNVSMLALSLNTNPTYLSAVIKEHKDKNFNNYINELRIRYICHKIHTQREYANYKISYLAEDCGFTSHSTFSTIFKKVTGIAPSVFLSYEDEQHSKKGS
ncbi:helix-turn-helix domain-containing protein [Flavobacterium wongokense]|uniref:helix-turn-helix domain-containing protein n=1 Tax=Flavobacterium wongokense TaxID=2910674 RepID=UPI001F23F24D|nr:helix-turn-helix domain-containing protein [Flavobacterium sp. WG47]MCF6133378.1 helix-turn-helix domain-containing protein [Flavobacterium sp. WG47]